MSAVNPFAGFNPRPSTWGYNWTAPKAPQPEPEQPPTQNHCRQPSPEPDPQLANMPAALLSTLKREKKPFTYTPGGVDLGEVLNHRLQRRLERKKRYCEEKASTPRQQVVVMPTHNSPLDMYSMENALEALETQATLFVNDRSLSEPSRSATLPRNQTFRFDDNEDRGVQQSKSFRVLQIITDTDDDQAAGRDHHHEEMRFSGLRDSRSIPSRFFHTLQKITGTEEEEQGSSGSSQETAPTSHPVLTAVQPQPVQAEPPNAGSPSLRRPAAFLPIKAAPGFRPVKPAFLGNGSVHRAAVTDF